MNAEQAAGDRCALLALAGLCVSMSMGCGVGATPAPVAVTITETAPAELAEFDPDRVEISPLESLRQFRQQGDFSSFVAAALATPISRDNPEFALEQAEALLTQGEQSAAQQAALIAAEGYLRPSSEPTGVVRALQLWTMSRLRQGLPLVDPELDRLWVRLSAEQQAALALGFWRERLADRQPYRLDASAAPSVIELKHSLAWTGLVSHELDGIEIEVNDSALPLVFIDTGAQLTLLSAEAATSAGVEVGDEVTELVGFATTAARPGVARRLRIGSLVLEDVPVLVGDSPSLRAAGGQAALGVDLLHHARLMIDYPSRRVTAVPASQPLPRVDDQAWRIPVWTFSHACLAQAETPAGLFARTLVDTGDRVGAFVSQRWLRQSVPGFRRPAPSLLPWVKRRKFQLAELELGGRSLKSWPIEDTFPPELERLDAVDVLLGHDLLGKYQVTIDLAGRQLLLVEPPISEAAEPADDSTASIVTDSPTETSPAATAETPIEAVVPAKPE